ncbi:MAG: GNAT family N-acetyltransferase [Mariprofundaceae bacterium]
MSVNELFVLRTMRAGDCRPVAEMHKAELADALLSNLGVRFLEKLYSYLLADPAFMGFVAVRDAKVCGFICLALNTSGLYRAIYCKHAFSLMLEVMIAGLKKPSLIWRAAQVVFFKSPDLNGDRPEAELLSIAVDGSMRSAGMGRRLIAHAVDAMRQRGETSMFVVVNEKIPANRFYQSCGFVKVSCALVHGDGMNFYTLEL